MDVATQIEARKKLVFSAKMACRRRQSREQWENNSEIQKFAKQQGLEHVLEHISAWVWTFRRR